MTKTFSRIRYFLLPLMLTVTALMPVACIEDGITTSPADQPEFSTDTLDFGDRFTDEMTATMRLMVYNRHDKIISISDIAVDDASSPFVLNVDGMSGRRFSNVEVRPNDSIYVLVSANLPATGSYTPAETKANLQFTTNGVTRSVVLRASSFDAERLTDLEITSDEVWEADRPRIIRGELRVAEGASLTLRPGTVLYFSDKASLNVEGRLLSEGTAEKPVTMRGSRIDNVLGDISFDLMSNQWTGVRFAPTSSGSTMSYTTVCNTTSGVRADSTSLSLTNCRLRNSGSHVLQAKDADIHAVGCEFAEAASSLLKINGGTLNLTNCTLSNYYLFSAITGAALQFIHTGPDNTDPDDDATRPYVNAFICNSIIYGSMSECNMKNLTGAAIEFRNCLMRSKGTDDDNFIDILWDTDPMFYTDRSAYIFDYRLRPESPAIGRSLQMTGALQLPATDYYGTPRPAPASLGAYEPRADQE